MRIRSLLSLLIILFCSQAYAQTSVTRLISLVNCEVSAGAYVPADSTAYRYHGFMTSNMKTGIYNYDSGIIYIYNSGSYHNYKLHLQSFDGKDSITIFYEKDWVDSNSTWADFYSQSSAFDTNGHVTNRGIIFPDNPGSDYSLWYSYNSNNMVDTIFKTGTGGPFDSLSLVAYTYNTSNQLTKEIYQNHIHVPPSFINDQEIDHNCNAAGLDTVKFTLQWDAINSVWRKFSRENYLYDGSNRKIATYYNTYVSGLGYVLTGMDTNQYDTHDNVTTSTHLLYDTATHTYSNYQKTDWTYMTTSPYYPLQKSSTSWVTSSWVALDGQDHETRYHYEVYNYVHPINKAVNNFNIYPVPAVSQVNISMQWNEPTPFVISIYDIQGRVITQMFEQATGNYHKTLPVSVFKAGTYVIRVQANGTDFSQQFTISK